MLTTFVMKSKRTKELEIPKKIKLIVWERDNHECIFCHKYVEWNYANSHYIKRSHGGLGIEQNIFTACSVCHHDFDDTPKRKEMLPVAKRHFMNIYDNWNEDDLVYKKWYNKS